MARIDAARPVASVRVSPSYAGAVTDAPAPAVLARDLTMAYGDHVAVRGATFDLPVGAVTAIIGPNGSGKTTLLRAISGLDVPVAGDLRVGSGHGLGGADTAFVMQANQVNDALPLTVTEVVRMGRYPHRGLVGRLRTADHAAVAEAMERMEVTDLADRHLRELSGGQRQRAFVAQGLAQQADLLLLDEPITGLDLPSQQRIDEAVRAEVAAGRTVVLTTHDVASAARADHVLLLATHVVASGPPDDVLTEDHLEHAYGRTAFRTAQGALVIGDPHVHGVRLSGHEDH